MDSSGPRKTFEPSTGEAKVTPSSVIWRSSARLQDLEAARIGQNGSLPLHEVMQIAMGLNDLGAGPQHQVKGIARMIWAPRSTEFFRCHRLDGAIVPTGNEGRRFDCAAVEVRRRVGPDRRKESRF